MNTITRTVLALAAAAAAACPAVAAEPQTPTSRQAPASAVANTDCADVRVEQGGGGAKPGTGGVSTGYTVPPCPRPRNPPTLTSVPTTVSPAKVQAAPKAATAAATATPSK